MYPFVLLFAAYLIGSVPSGLIIGRVFYRTDLREYGSKNIGATNAYRVLGAFAGLVVLLMDTGKGLAGVWLGQTAGHLFSLHDTIYFMILGGLLALVGHSASIFLKFKGGKGVATGLGIMLYLAPWETLIVFAVWCAVVAATRFVSLGSVVAAVLMPILMWVFDEPTAVLIFGITAALIVVIRHKDNVIRLLHGKELKVKRLEKK